ncbi:hypothetical protein, partial [Avibacterium paragallinarum]|uniref:hypothetical protein n=1 Tax=Avibacterium paragallinarum TaxID=728 RepID=UPI003985B6AD
MCQEGDPADFDDIYKECSKKSIIEYYLDNKRVHIYPDGGDRYDDDVVVAYDVIEGHINNALENYEEPKKTPQLQQPTMSWLALAP